MQKLRLQHLITVSDLFWNFDMVKLKGRGNIKRRHKCADKPALAKKIFLSYMKHLFTEFLQGGQVFLFPGRIPYRMLFRRMKDSKFKYSLQDGRISGLDILMSEFKYYEPILTKEWEGKHWTIPIKLSENYKQIVTDKVNTGYKYC